MCEDVQWVDKLDLAILLANTTSDEVERTQSALFEGGRTFADMILPKTDASGVSSEFVIEHPFYVNARFLGFMPHMVWAEVFLLICTKDPKYAEYRSKILKAGKTTTPVVISVISGAVAQRWGITSAACVPLVAAALACVVKVTTEVVCQTIRKSLPEVASPNTSLETPARKKPKRKAKGATKPKKRPRKGT